MDFQLEPDKTARSHESRSHERIKFHCSVILDIGKQVDEGRILDLSVQGCLVESSVSVKVGANLQLRISLPGPEPPLRVPCATVRWTKGFQFGVEFMELEETDRVRLNRVLTGYDDPWSQSLD